MKVGNIQFPRDQRSAKAKLILNLGMMLGWQEVRQAYRRSVLGQFWITMGMAIQVVTMGVVFGLIFKSPLVDYLPFLCTSIVIWGFISTTINDSALAFTSSEAMIRQLSLNHIVYVLKVIWKNMVVFGHNIVIVPICFLILGKQVSWSLLLFGPGIVLLLLNLSWMSYLIATVSARFRDIPPIINSFMMILFYVTPVMWLPSLIEGGTAHILLGLNPFYHLLQIVRLPMIGEWPTGENWLLSSLFAVLGLAVAKFVSVKYKSKIAYWV